MNSRTNTTIKKVIDEGSYLKVLIDDDGEPFIKIINWDDQNFDPTTRTFIQQQNFDKNGELRIGGVIKKRETVVEQEVINSHPIFGEYADYETNRRKYSMVYHIGYEPIFTKKIYRAHWDYLIYKVDKSTNAIYFMRGHYVVLATLYKQLAKICHVTLRTYKLFHQELLEKGYMTEVILNGCKYFIMNPLYVRNGNPLTKMAYNLFDIKI
tara:strand:+ start:1223 stop:1852 length:630 start_codon:yes stop_codon:yes gene_type:complete